MRESKIQYNPSLSVKENATRNNVTEAAIRYYIKVNNIDRRFDRTQNLIADCRKYLKKHPNATKAELHEKTGHSLSTIRIYWKHITTEKELMNFDSKKKQKRQLRQLNNFYATHPSCTADILREEEFHKDVLEPFCGVGSMSEVIRQNGHNVLSYDIVDRGYGLVGDFYRTEFPRRKYDIITNPPYDNVIDVVLRCIDICKEKVALLMPLRYLSSGSRYNEIYKKYPPKRVYVYQERICIAKNADFEKYNDAGANMEIYAWYIWERGYKGTTELKWISNQKAVTKKTLKNTAKVKELKEQVDALMKVEAENTAALKANPSYLPIPTKQDFLKEEQYNVSEHLCVPFRSKGDMWQGIQIPLGNMNGGYSYMMHGVTFPTSEHAYIFGIFSNDNEEHIALQKELLANTNGLTIKRGIRYKNAHLCRKDWREFNIEWMLHCVWTKANQCEEFKKLLLSLPQGITIIEDVSFKHYDENGADFWGARNPDKATFDNLAKKYAEHLGLSEKATKEGFIWKYYNVGTYTGRNVMGKILTYIKQCLHDGTEPDIDYELLKSKNIHFLGNLIDFDSSDAKYQPSQCDRALVLDFDMTLFNTATDREARLNKDWKAVYNEIPNYTLYDGWREVFKYAQENGVKIIVISRAKGEIIKRALKHYDLHCDVVIGGGVWGHPKKTSKNSGKLIDIALQEIGCQDMPKSRIISIGDSVTDKNMSDNAGVKFYGAIWDCEKEESYAELSKGDTIQSPLEVISLLEDISIEEPSETKPVEVVEKKPTKKKQAKEAKADKKPKKINTTIRCTDTHVYFYQNTPLSNWWVSEPAIPYDNHTFTSTESLFMYLKAKVFRDDVMAERIANAHYDDAKKLGRLIQNFSDEVWERERENAMYIAIKAKLAVDEVFRDTLLSEEYKGKTFVEASPTDKVWGIRRSISDAYQGKEWRGLNLLGKLLTELRDVTLGLIEPKEREITPINPDEIKTIEPVKAVPSKNTYSTEGVMVRSILGSIIGDIAGSSREGYSKNVLSPRKILTAQSCFTDDSILTIAVADWLNNKDKTSLKDCLIKWHNRYPHAGFGKLFDRFAETGEAQESNGNGGAMRVAPCGVLAKTIEEAVSLAEQQCIVSHTTDVAINGAKAIAAAVFIAKDGASRGKTDVEIKQDVKSYVEEHYGYNLNMTLEEIQAQSVELAKQREAFRRDGIESPSYLNMSNASLSCPMAITAFLLGKNYEEAIRYALAMMGDADTIACMAGCISAQVYGMPQQLIEDALVYLPIEMIDVLNEFEPENNFEPSGITPPVINKWTEKAETVVYGSGDEQNENGGAETIASRFNPHPRFGYAIPTIGKSIEEIQDGVNAFIEHAKNNPDMRFHVRKIGYDKAGYTIEQIAPLFREARTVRNILLPKAIVDVLN